MGVCVCDRFFSRDLGLGQRSHSTLVGNTCFSQGLLFRLAHSFPEGVEWLDGEAWPYFYSVPPTHHVIAESIIA